MAAAAAAAGHSEGAAGLPAEESTPADAPPRFTCDFEETPAGDFIWHASLVLLHYLQKPKQAQALKGARVLELGSGLGHCGHGLARLGAHITCTEQAKCVPTLESTLKKLDREQGPATENGGSLRVVELSWGEEGWASSALATEEQPFDFIISAELVFLEELHELLLWTFLKAMGPETVVYSVFVNRPFSWMFFAKLHDLDKFEVEQLEEERDFDACGLEECHMHRVTLKVQ